MERGTTVLDATDAEELLSDVQGVVVRGYKMPHARHLLVRVDSVAAARALLGSLVDGTPGRPQVTRAASWADKPDSTLTVAVTAEGLDALGVSLATFPAEFTEGAAARARVVGDVGPSDPVHWRPVFTSPELHLVFSMTAMSKAAWEGATDALLAGTVPGLTVLDQLDADLLPGRTDHFGYVDGISQPTVEPAPPPGPPDRMAVQRTGAFLLGHPSQFTDHRFPVPDPPELGHNGSFAALRVMAQDVDAFRDLLAEQSRRTGMDPELVAAKLCGRWRSGTPLVLSPGGNTALAEAALNDFAYAGDERGERCPIGAHVRRMYPRDSRVAGGGPDKRRIVRRGLTYGPPYDPARPRDGRERGVIGLFIGASLKEQFEFILAEWAHGGDFAPGLHGTQDPFLGAGGTFRVPVPGGRTELTDLPRLVTTRGGAYVFLPSITGIRHLAGR